MIKFKIHSLMGNTRMSQKQLSETTGIHPSVIAKYYHDTIVRINREHLDEFCKIFNCNISDLIEYIPDDDSNTTD
ncbi:helix-turn-helix domain-containing protein [Fusobacterium ulcerans]|uniref:HTH cro/C1-type domain-containing protein n=1 Tax=Fusobacterium ulcerans 12-1B TaxID=457404 RepID=H1PTU3_9FUSO|nr:helix-turn-helix transcriptional regulator [Fusobacterium ulcerans]EHO80763.1 hypothetical protein HMPREF0402_01836 [Fusobacterium ulcerans 12-1B]